MIRMLYQNRHCIRSKQWILTENRNQVANQNLVQEYLAKSITVQAHDPDKCM